MNDDLRDASALDELIRGASHSEPIPVDLEARVRSTVAAARAETIASRRGATVTSILFAATSLAAAAAVAFVLMPAASLTSSTPGESTRFTEGPTVLSVGLTDPVDQTLILDARDATPIAVASTNSDITIVWMVPNAPSDPLKESTP